MAVRGAHGADVVSSPGPRLICLELVLPYPLVRNAVFERSLTRLRRAMNSVFGKLTLASGMTCTGFGKLTLASGMTSSPTARRVLPNFLVHDAGIFCHHLAPARRAAGVF